MLYQPQFVEIGHYMQNEVDLAEQKYLLPYAVSGEFCLLHIRVFRPHNLLKHISSGTFVTSSH